MHLGGTARRIACLLYTSPSPRDRQRDKRTYSSHYFAPFGRMGEVIIMQQSWSSTRSVIQTDRTKLSHFMQWRAGKFTQSICSEIMYVDAAMHIDCNRNVFFSFLSLVWQLFSAYASPSVRLSVTEVHWRIIANLGFKFRYHFTCKSCNKCLE